MSRLRQQRTTWLGLCSWSLLVAPLIYGAAFPLWKLTWLAWIGLAPWYVTLRVSGRRAAVLIACASTLLGSYVCTTWLPSAVAHYYQQPLAIGLLLFMGVYLLTIAPYITCFALGYRRLAHRPSAWLPLLTGAAWAAGEMARVRLFIGEPFGLFGYSQIDVTAVVQVADVTGVFGVSFILMAVNAALAELWLAYGRDRLTSEAVPVCTPAQAWRGLLLVVVTLAMMGGYGAWRVHAFDGTPATAATDIAIVQGNLDLGSQWRQEFYGLNLDEYMRLTSGVLRTEHPQLVFWPESAMTFLLADEPQYRAAIGRLLTPTHTELVAGAPCRPASAALLQFRVLDCAGWQHRSGLRQAATFAVRRILPVRRHRLAAPPIRSRTRVHSRWSGTPAADDCRTGRRRDLQRSDVRRHCQRPCAGRRELPGHVGKRLLVG